MGRHNLGTVISFEVIRTLTKKRFWIATLVVPLALIIVIGLVVWSNETTSRQVSEQKTAEFTFTYVDDSGYVDPAVATALGGAEATDREQALEDVKAGRIDALFEYPSDPVTQPTMVYGVDSGVFENGKYAAVARHILVTSSQARIGDETVAALVQGNVSVTSTTYKDGGESGGMNEVFPPLIFLLIFYVVIILLGNQMVTSLLEEKENRVTEMILTSLDPTTLVIGKVVSLFIIGVVQIVVFVVPIIIGYVFFRTTLNLPYLDLSHLVVNPGSMIVGALLFVGGFTAFTGTLVAIGAVMPTIRDAGQVFAPLMIMIFVPFYAISLVVSDPHALIVQVFTYFPYTATVTVMLRNAFGTVSPLEATIVIVEQFVLSVVMLRLAVRLFRYGSISYTQKVSIRAVLSSPK